MNSRTDGFFFPRWPLIALAATLVLSGCVLTPTGMKEEQANNDLAGKAYEPVVEDRVLPELPAEPTWRDVLQRAFLANGDLEAVYFEWKGALARIPQVANYPNSNLAPSFSYMFSGGRMKAFDRTTVNVGFDPMENLSFPTKVAKAGEIALQEARAAGKRFEAKKFEIQQKILTAYLELALHEEKIRIQRENVGLLKLLAETAADRVRAGGNRQDLLKAQTDYRLAENELANMESMHMSMRAMLNGMMARDPNAPLNLPKGLPEPRPIAADDARLIQIATDNNPELADLARQAEGRKDALELARMGFIPDINPIAAFSGGLSQTIGAMVIIPTTIPEIRGKIDESRAMLRSSEAMLRQVHADRAASFVAALYVLRNAERQVGVLERSILPQAQQALAGSRQAYAAGTGNFLELVDSRRTLLEVRLMIAEQRIEREKRLAELETLAGVDIETLAEPTTAPSSQPSTRASSHQMDRKEINHD
jgi:cobalt-zinc-cadmium efflux system outer membrane protein